MTSDGELRSGAHANLLMGVTSDRVDVRRAVAITARALEQLAEALEHVVGPRAGGDQLRFRRGFEIGTAEPQRALEAAILVEDDAGCDQRRPGEMVRQSVGPVAVFDKVQHEK